MRKMAEDSSLRSSSMLLLSALLAVAPRLVAEPTLPEIKEIDGDAVTRLLKPDAIPAIDEPKLIRAKDAISMAHEEQVIGVVIDGEARAYSTWYLDSHEIVNDRMKGSAIAVTW